MFRRGDGQGYIIDGQSSIAVTSGTTSACHKVSQSAIKKYLSHCCDIGKVASNLHSKLREWDRSFQLHGGTVISTAASQHQGPGFDSRLGSVCGNLHILPVSAWVSSGCSGFLPQSKGVRVRWIGHAKLSLSVRGISRVNAWGYGIVSGIV